MTEIPELDDKTIIRVKHGTQNPYFLMARETAQDRSLSYDALGMLAYLLSKPDDWQVSVADLMRDGCGRDKTLRILSDLLDQHYALHGKQETDPTTHQFKPLTWVIFERPYTENPYTASGTEPYTESRLLETRNGLSLGSSLKSGALITETYTDKDQQNTETDQKIKDKDPAPTARSVTTAIVTLPSGVQATLTAIPQNLALQGNDGAPATTVASLPPTPDPPIAPPPLPPPHEGEGDDEIETRLHNDLAWRAAICEILPVKENQYGFIGKYRKFFTGKFTSGAGKDKDWFENQIDAEMNVTPVMLMAYRRWYKHQYADTYAKQGNHVAQGRAALGSKFEDFLASEYFDRCMELGREDLLALLKIDVAVEEEYLPKEEAESRLNAYVEGLMQRGRTTE